MNIAIINVVGVEGSTGKIATKLAANYMSKGNICKIFHGRGEPQNNNLYVKHGNKVDTIVHYALSRLTGKEGYYSTHYTKALIKDLQLFNPDRILIINLHGHWLNVPLFLNTVSEWDVHISWFMADDYPFTARCEYALDCVNYKNRCEKCDRFNNASEQYKVKEKYYEKLKEKTVFSSVEYIVNRAKESSLLSDGVFKIINTGIDVDFYKPVNSDDITNKYAIDDKKVILLNVAPFSNKRKGVEMFLDAAKLLVKDDKYLFINVGYDGPTNDLPENYLAIPYVSNQEELREFYSLADAYVCTSIQDALPNACVEAMSCGTPLVAFNTSGMPFLADYPVLTLVNDVSTEALADTIKTLKKKTHESIEQARSEAVKKYAFSDFANRLLIEG